MSKTVRAHVRKGKTVRQHQRQEHPGFKAAQAEIARKQGISPERAGAILAAGARNASAAAKAANPRLRRVKG